MSGVDRERIADLLKDASLSYRAIGRMTGASDWTVRRIARELDGDERPMKCRYVPPADDPSAEASPAVGWLVLGGVIGCIALMIWAGTRGLPPPEF